MIGDDRTGLEARRRGDLPGPAVQGQGREAFTLKVVLIPLDHFFLAVHEVDVIAEEEVEVLVTVARQSLPDGLELKEKIEPERADKAETGIVEATKLVNKEAQDR